MFSGGTKGGSAGDTLASSATSGTINFGGQGGVNSPWLILAALGGLLLLALILRK